VVYLFQDHTPVESSAATFESAFLPTRYSDLENVSLSYIYRIPGGFWLRINLVRNHEGAGAYQGMFILEFKDGNGRLLAGNSELYMYWGWLWPRAAYCAWTADGLDFKGRACKGMGRPGRERRRS